MLVLELARERLALSRLLASAFFPLKILEGPNVIVPLLLLIFPNPLKSPAFVLGREFEATAQPSGPT